MPTRKPIPVEQRARIMLENRHAAYVDMIEELAPYVEKWPNDTWARGQLEYAKKESKRLAELIALADNRQDRPV